MQSNITIEQSIAVWKKVIKEVYGNDSTIWYPQYNWKLKAIEGRVNKELNGK